MELVIRHWGSGFAPKPERTEAAADPASAKAHTDSWSDLRFDPGPRDRFLDGVIMTVGGLIATGTLFCMIPIMQRIAEIERLSPSPAVEWVEPAAPEDPVVEKPVVIEPEPPPPVEPQPLEMGADSGYAADLPDLGSGLGASLVVRVPVGSGVDGTTSGLPGGPGGADQPPVAVTRTDPVYPPLLLRKGIGGRVVVAAWVTPRGEVEKPSIHTGSGRAELDRAAVQAIGRWRFRAAVLDGEPIRARILQPFKFETR